jgi:hypothetical protein
MCFTRERSALYGIVGLTIAGVVLILWRVLKGRTFVGPRTQPTAYIALPIAYFASMEFIQVAQHSIAAPSLDSPECDTWYNQALTMVGAMHIAFQPLAIHFGFGGHYKQFLPSSYPMLVRLVALGCLIDATMMLTGLSNGGRGMRFGYDWESCGAYSWTVGNKLCTYRGEHHLAWSIPFPKPSYYYHGALHSFTFFAPFLIVGRGSHLVRGILLFLTGPILAEYLTGWRRHESPSVWCYAFLFNNLSVYFHGLIFDLIDLAKGSWKLNGCADSNGYTHQNGHAKANGTNGLAKQNGNATTKQNGHMTTNGNGCDHHDEHVAEPEQVNPKPLILDFYESLCACKVKAS